MQSFQFLLPAMVISSILIYLLLSGIFVSFSCQSGWTVVQRFVILFYGGWAGLGGHWDTLHLSPDWNSPPSSVLQSSCLHPPHHAHHPSTAKFLSSNDIGWEEFISCHTFRGSTHRSPHHHHLHHLHLHEHHPQPSCQLLQRPAGPDPP